MGGKVLCNGLCNGITGITPFFGVSFLLLALVLIAGNAHAQICAKAADRAFLVPFTDAHGVILVELKVNEKPSVLLFDTGATTTLLKTPGLVEIRVTEHDVYAVQANDLGKMSSSNTKTMAMLGIVGILGEDFLHKFRSVRIDYMNHILELEPR